MKTLVKVWQFTESSMQDAPEAAVVTAENDAYEKLLKVKVGNDNYTSVETQTISSLHTLCKSKEVQTQVRSCASAQTQATRYDLFRHMNHASVLAPSDSTQNIAVTTEVVNGVTVQVRSILSFLFVHLEQG